MTSSVLQLVKFGCKSRISFLNHLSHLRTSAGTERQVHSFCSYQNSGFATMDSKVTCHLHLEQHRWFNTTDRYPSIYSFQSSTSLGIFDRLVSPNVNSIASLPEVATALNEQATLSTIEGLRRAEEILESMPGPLHTAVLGLLADSFYSLGMYDESITILQQIQPAVKRGSAHDYLQVDFAIAKAMYLNGNFESALQAVTALLDKPEMLSSLVSRGKLMNTKGIIILANLDTEKAAAVQDTIESIDLLQIAANTLEQESPKDASEAFNNLGVAHAVSSFESAEPKHREAAISSLQIALQKVQHAEENQYFLRGCIYSNMAQILLDGEPQNDSDLKLASEYSREAMLIFEQKAIDINLTELERQNGLSRALTLVALCYVRANSAVMAEGLYQAAIDKYVSTDPFIKMAHRDSLSRYSDLCKKWEKREADARRLEQTSNEVNSSIPHNWRDKHGIMCGLTIPRSII
mmetsp:Transcript_2474/g.3646  ORF Transcript_2474/g.3646 Transcript_2474/m.3646 type:complete len:464 (-) Transcript_2474:37-1428(-)